MEPFYQKNIRDKLGQVRQIAGCVSAVRETLGAMENRFKGLLREIASGVRAGKVRVEDASGYARGVQELSHGWWRQIGDGANESAAVDGQFLRKTYRYHFYLLHRAREYAEGDAAAINPELNDFEDACLCLHLGLADFAAVVTNDVPLLRCLRALNEMGFPGQARLRVWDTQRFSAG